MKIFLRIFILFIPFNTFSQSDNEIITFSYVEGVLKVSYSNPKLRDSIDYEVDMVDENTFEVIIKNKIGMLKTIRFIADKDTTFEVDLSAFALMRKPIIYIYSKQNQNIDLKIKFNGKLEITYPYYNEKWILQVRSDGTLINLEDNKQHRYLFWEGVYEKQFLIQDFSEGFVIKGNQTVEFLDSILTVAGFNDFEKNDFISYWLPYMSIHKKIFVHFLINEQCNQIAEYNCSKNIDTYLRIYMIFSPIENDVIILPQKIPKCHREGLTLVEWGGTQINANILD